MKPNNFDIPLYERWLREKNSYAESTVYEYCVSLKRFLKDNPDVDNIDDYNKFLIEVTKKKRCIHYFFILKLYIDFKIKNEKLKEHMLKNLIKPKQRQDYLRERRYLTEEEIFRVINYIRKPKHKLLALIQSVTGVRAGDILRLKKDGGIMNEDYNGKPIIRLNIIGKRNRRNVVFVHDETLQNLIMEYTNTHVSNTDYYFVDKTSAMFKHYGQESHNFVMIRANYLRYWNDLKQALAIAGVHKDDFSTHDFRRCFARRNWTKYKDILVLQKALRHADPKNTLRYLEQSGMDTIDIHYEMQQ